MSPTPTTAPLAWDSTTCPLQDPLLRPIATSLLSGIAKALKKPEMKSKTNVKNVIRGIKKKTRNVFSWRCLIVLCKLRRVISVRLVREVILMIMEHADRTLLRIVILMKPPKMSVSLVLRVLGPAIKEICFTKTHRRSVFRTLF
jgi:CRISPR/Cas system CMR-associated protein Cmr1 (group 7 of RAMP superfamily)